MKRIALTLFTLPALPQEHTLATEGNHFTLDGKPFQVVSGELHYARIPPEYWHARLKMARAMGLNTIATYVFWNVHEPTPGHSNFSGQYGLAAFLKAAQEEGLYVIFRAGPYACAEWEFGGFPSWLLKDPAMSHALRTNDPAFMVPAQKFITRLAQETSPLLAVHGGPILAVQVENEDGNFGNEKGYMQHMLEIFQGTGFKDALLCTVDPSKALAYGSLPGILAGVNFGTGNAEPAFAKLVALRPGRFSPRPNPAPAGSRHPPWLKKGRSEVVLFDLSPAKPGTTLAGLTKPILDGSTPTYATDPERKKKEAVVAEFGPRLAAPATPRRSCPCICS